MNRSPLILSFLALTLMATPGWADQLLPPTFMVGKEYRMSQVQKIEMTIPGMGEGAANVIDITMEMTVQCQEGDAPGLKHATSSISRMKMNMNAMGMQMVYDSEVPGSEQTMLGQQVSKAVGKPFTVVLNAKDEVVEIKGLDELLAQGGGQQMFQPDQLQTLMNPGAIMGIPAAGVSKGEEWTQEQKLPIGQMGNLATNITVKYADDKAVDDKPCAVLDYTIKVDADEVPGMQGMAASLKESSMTGKLMMDKELRFPRSGTMTGEMGMTMSNPQNPAAAMTMDMTLKQDFKLISVTDIE